MGYNERVCMVLTKGWFDFCRQPLYYLSAMFCEPLEVVSDQSYLSLSSLKGGLPTFLDASLSLGLSSFGKLSYLTASVHSAAATTLL